MTDARVEAATDAIMKESEGRLISWDDAHRFAVAALAAAQAGAMDHGQLFVVHNPKATAVYIFDNHDAALRCRTELKLDHWHLWGQVVSSDWRDGQPIRAPRPLAPAESVLDGPPWGVRDSSEDPNRALHEGMRVRPEEPYTRPLSASEPAGAPSEEDVAKLLCCPMGCQQPHQLARCKSAHEQYLVKARLVMALLQRGGKE